MTTRLLKIDGVALAAIACFITAIAPFAPSAASNVAGIILCFVLTGVALACAVLPVDASPAAWIAALVAGSIGTGIVGGLAINYLPSGIVRSNWLVFALVVTLLACGFARVTGRSGPVKWELPKPAIPKWDTIARGVTAVFVWAAVALISLSSQNREPAFVELWLVPEGPEQSPAGATQAELGIKSHEFAAEEFTIVLDTGAQIVASRVTLAPNQVWSQTVPVEGPRAVASVYRGDAAGQPYRTVWIVR